MRKSKIIIWRFMCVALKHYRYFTLEIENMIRGKNV